MARRLLLVIIGAGLFSLALWFVRNDSHGRTRAWLVNLAVLIPPVILFVYLRGIPTFPPASRMGWLLWGLPIVGGIGMIENGRPSLPLRWLIRGGFLLGVGWVLGSGSTTMETREAIATLVGVYGLVFLGWEHGVRSLTATSQQLLPALMGIVVAASAVYGGIEASLFVGELLIAGAGAILPWALLSLWKPLRGVGVNLLAVTYGVSILYGSYFALFTTISAWPFVALLATVNLGLVARGFMGREVSPGTAVMVLAVVMLIAGSVVGGGIYQANLNNTNETGSYRPYGN